MENKPIVIGIAGGSGSGKTSVTYEVCKRFSEDSILIIEQDNYYKDQSNKAFEDRLLTNYDHPDAFDNALLIEQIKQLLNYETIMKPTYDYKRHTRSSEVIKVEPRDVIIVEGILIFHDEKLMDLMDIKVFIDTDADVRIIRRLLRDIKDRGRTLDSVIDQYLNFVRPMHLQFVEPSKYRADIIVPEGGENEVAIDMIATKIKQYIEQLKENNNNI